MEQHLSLDHSPTVETGLDRPGEEALGYAKSARSDATWKAYDSDWDDWVTWASSRGLPAIPASPASVADYLAALAVAGAATATIRRRAAAISVVHGTANMASPCQHEVVRRVLAGIARRNIPARRATAMTISDLHRMLAVCDSDALIDLRDRALLLLGFVGAFRRSELVSVEVSHLTRTEAGIRVFVPTSKTDQEGWGDTKAIPFGSDPQTCPVAAVDAWLERSGVAFGPVLRGVNRHGKVGSGRMDPGSVARIVHRLARKAGLGSGNWSGHSLRAGFVTTAAARGASERSIARQTGHSPSSPVLRGYIRHASAFTDNAATDLGI